MHVSLKLNTPCEFINLEPVNPLISKVQIKVCYVGDTPNRNGTVITKQVGAQLANSLPGSPIVGFYNETKGDFEEHNRIIDLSNGKFEFKDTTRPYGFVDLNARAWFQKFEDDGVEHEYLMTEGYIWTGQYPEAKRILAKGNNQSMEIENVEGTWTKSTKDDYEFFIINEAIISKLCILGEDVEPCFEGAGINKFEFSFDENFVKTYSMFISEMNNLIKGGTPVEDKDMIVDEEVKEEEIVDEEKPEGAPAEEEEKPAEEAAPEAEEEEEIPAEEEVKEEEEIPAEEEKAEEGEPEPSPEFHVEDTQEYKDLMARCSALEEEVTSLRAFKLESERKDKLAMIDSFYMLSDEEKADVIENVDKYSLDDIEAKLSVICVRNKVNFNLEDENTEKKETVVFSLDNEEEDDAVTPAWVKAIQKVAKNKK